MIVQKSQNQFGGKDIWSSLAMGAGPAWLSWGGSIPGSWAAMAANPVLGVIGGPISVFAMAFTSMIGAIFRTIPTCQDPFTGKILKGTGECMAAAWRANCGNPETHDPKKCGPDLYDPGRINCPEGSTASGISQFGVPIGNCVCNMSVFSPREAIKIGCQLSPVYRYAPVALILAGVYLTLRQN